MSEQGRMTMSEQTARERIAETVKEAYDWGLSDATYSTNCAADRIIDIVREAVLNGEAVGAAIDSAGNEFVGVYNDARDMLDAALDAAFGSAG